MSDYLEFARQVRSFSPLMSERVSSINRIFGLSPDGQDIIILGSAQVPSVGIVYITGLSGSGKTTLLKMLSEQRPEAKQLPIIDEEEAPLVDLLNTSVSQSIRWLGKFGLGEAKLMTTPYKFLSDGQKARTRLALLMWDKPACVIIDEFLSTLDRLTAKIVAFNFQKLCRELGTTAYLASAHDDLQAPLAPDYLIEIDLSGEVTTTCISETTTPYIPGLEEIEIAEGGPEDYHSLARFHYTEHLASEAPITEDDWKYTISQIRVAKFQGKSIGVVLCSYLFPSVFNTMPFFRLLNESFLIIFRTIVHPGFRGIGLSKNLLQPTVSEKTRYLVSCSAMGIYYPFFLGAGFEKIEHPRNLRYTEHSELDKLLEEYGIFDTDRLHKYHYAQEIFNQLDADRQIRLRQIVSRIVIRSNIDYCIFFGNVLGTLGDIAEYKEELEKIFTQSVNQVGNEEFGTLLSESLYFPVQGFIKPVEAKTMKEGST